MSVPTLGNWDALLRLALAAGLGGAVGFERELRDREAGIRTHLLVALGSALFTIISAYGFNEFLVSGGATVRADPTRIAAQIVTGIGFLGAGAIIRDGLSVRGLTTASHALGRRGGRHGVRRRLLLAGGCRDGADARRARAAARGRVPDDRRIKPEEKRLIVELREGEPLGPFLATLHDVRHFELTRKPTGASSSSSSTRSNEDVVAGLADLPGVIGVRWRR